MMRTFLETKKTIPETLTDLDRLLRSVGITNWVPIASVRGPGYRVKFLWNGKWIPVTSTIQPTPESNLRMCYRALHHVFEMEARGVTGMVQKITSEMSMAVSRQEVGRPIEYDYAILGLNQSATLGDIKHAYNKLAMIDHPDTGGDTELFVILKKAYDNIIRSRS